MFGRSLAVLIFLCVLILLFTSLTVCLSSAGAEEKPKTKRYRGIVHEVHIDEKTLVVGKEKKSLAMLFDASKTLYANSKGLQELKIGDKVAIDYDAAFGKTIAVVVTKER